MYLNGDIILIERRKPRWYQRRIVLFGVYNEGMVATIKNHEIYYKPLVESPKYIEHIKVLRKERRELAQVILKTPKYYDTTLDFVNHITKEQYQYPHEHFIVHIPDDGELEFYEK